MKYFIVPDKSTGLTPLEITESDLRIFHKIVMMRRYPLNPNNASMLHEFAQSYGKQFMMLFLKVGLFFNSLKHSNEYIKTLIYKETQESEGIEVFSISGFLDFCEKEFEGEIECHGNIIT